MKRTSLIVSYWRRHFISLSYQNSFCNWSIRCCWYVTYIINEWYREKWRKSRSSNSLSCRWRLRSNWKVLVVHTTVSFASWFKYSRRFFLLLWSKTQRKRWYAMRFDREWLEEIIYIYWCNQHHTIHDKKKIVNSIYLLIL